MVSNRGCHFPIQHIVQKGWRTLIPHENALMMLMLLPQSTIGQIVCMTKGNKSDVLLGGRTSGLDGLYVNPLDFN